MIHEESLRKFGAGIQRLTEGRDLSREECGWMFRQVLGDRQPELQQGAFLAALRAKGETPQEIAGAWEAIMETDTVTARGLPQDCLVENSGTGMDALKTFNISSAAAVVAAAGGVCMARHGSRALTSSCGTVDLMEAVGVDVECSIETVSRSIHAVGIGLFNGASRQVHPRALGRILSRIRFGTTLNIAASLASPCRPTHALRGVFAADWIEPVAAVMEQIGYRRALVVHGFDSSGENGMDELSNIGPSRVCELLADGRTASYWLAPEDVGLGRSAFADIAALGEVRAEAIRLLQVLGAVAHPACIDAVCLNAGALFYLTGRSPDIAAGAQHSRELIAEDRALQTLCRWVAAQTDHGTRGEQMLLEVAAQAGLSDRVAALL